MASPSQNVLDLSDFAGTWKLDPDRTSIEFHTRALWVIPAKGTFRSLEGVGTVTADGSIAGTLVIDAASVDTKNKKRNAHLRTADFLEVESFPTITYEVTSGRADVTIDRSAWGLTLTPLGAGLKNRVFVRGQFSKA